MIDKFITLLFNNPEKAINWFFRLWLAWVGLIIVGIITLVVVAIHFISKYW